MAPLKSFFVLRSATIISSIFRLTRINGVLCSCDIRNTHNNPGLCAMDGKMLTGSKYREPGTVSVRSLSKIDSSSIFKKVARRFWNKKEREEAAFRLYRSIESVNFKEFFSFLQMPDTFNSWFVLMELHVWILMSQLVTSTDEGIQLRNKIVEFLWSDVEFRLKNLGSLNLKIVKKQLKELSGRFPVAMLVYDEGLLGTDTVLAGALWYKFFDKQPQDPRKLEVLVQYIRYQVHHMSSINFMDYDEVQKLTDIWHPHCFSKFVMSVE